MNTGPIFISYAHSDQVLAKSIQGDLELRGCSVWLDEKDIKVGDSISAAVEKALESAEFICLILSPESVSRPWVQREYRAALNIQLSNSGRPRILPVLVERTEIPVLLRDIKYADFRSGYTKGIAELYAAIGVVIEPAPFVEVINKLRVAGDPVASVAAAMSRDHGTFRPDIWFEFMQEFGRLRMELDQHPDTRFRLLEASSVQSFLQSDDHRTGLIRAPSVEYSDSVDYLAFMDNVSVSYRVGGLDTFVGLVCEYWAPVVARRVYVVPERCTASHEGSFPDGMPWSDEILFDDVFRATCGDGDAA